MASVLGPALLALALLCLRVLLGLLQFDELLLTHRVQLHVVVLFATTSFEFKVLNKNRDFYA